MASAAELDAMRRAIELSAGGLGSASPNPPVGCVLLDQAGAVVGEGFHVRKGDPHAERIAADAADGHARRGTAVVTLEPCCHHGRTPPCTDALLAAGVERVIVAVMDPTSRGEGGVALLRDAGLEVEVGILGREARGVVGFWLRALELHRPIVTILSDAAEVAKRRSTFDAIVRSDGGIEEGRHGAHGQGVFSLPPTLSGTPDQWLADLFARGVRSLAVGSSTLADLAVTEETR